MQLLMQFFALDRATALALRTQGQVRSPEEDEPDPKTPHLMDKAQRYSIREGEASGYSLDFYGPVRSHASKRNFLPSGYSFPSTWK